MEDLFFSDCIPSKLLEDPFFHYYNPYSYSPPPQRPPSQPSQPSQPRRQRKVVSIPVHHVHLEKKRSESAKKIQKVFRGFRVRKTVKKIVELEKEVDDVQRKLFEGETMAVIRRNNLERLKVSEALMAILFKLDSIRGIDGGVRELRKAVITKAITLQEIVDSAISDENLESSGEIDMNVDTLTEETDRNVDQLAENFDDSSEISEKIDSKTLDEDVEVNEKENFDDSSTMQLENSEEINSQKTCNEIGTETLEQCEEDDAENWECIEDGNGEKKSDSNNGDWYVIEGGNNGEDEKEKEDKLLEKMAEDNQRLIAMVADLCQKNATQMSLISSLSQRVEQLEKEMNDRLNKKKKKKCTSLTYDF